MKLIVNDQLVTYGDEGTGKVILLLHGWGASLGTFTALTKDLSDNYRVISLDFPGFGASPKPNDSWHVDDYAQLVKAMIQKLEVDPYAMVGHSFGGRVILKAVGNNYLDPEKIVLMSSAGVKPKASLRQFAYALAAKIGKLILKLPLLSRFQVKLRRRLYESAGSTDYLEAEAMRPIFLNVINEDLQADAAKIQQPSLLLWGEDDDSTPVSDARTLHDAIKNSQLRVIPNAGHFVYIDKYDEAAKAIKDFLA